MAKKNKQPPQTTTNDPNNKPDSDIFKALFGGGQTLDQEEQSATNSIFSDSNPFRRKPTKPKPQIPNTHQEKSGLDGEIEIEDLPTNRKRKKEKNPNLELNSNAIEEEEEVALVGKKSKNGEIEIEGEVDNVGKNKKKKRKRDEIEAEYEEKRYGAAKDEGGGEGKSGKEVVGEKRKKLDNPADMHITKDGFDDEDKLLRTVFVGNLPLKVKKKALLKEFSQFGEIESVRLRSIPLLDDKTPRKGAIMKKQINDAVDRVNAYIVFKAEESAQASLSHNMAVVGGNHIHVDRACPPRKKLKGENSPLYDNKRTVFVGNLPFDVKDEEIYQLFSGINNLKTSIEAIRVIRDPGTSMGKGIAYVLFKTREAANVVVRKHNMKIRDRELRVSHAAAPNSTPATPSKRKNSFPSEKYSTPTKKFATGTTPDSGKTLSYQGTRATKSGGQKKVASQKRSFNQEKSESRPLKMPKKKERTTKRPAVAARRGGAATGPPSGGGSAQAGKKRKAGSHTPQSNNRHKKARKFK